MIFLAIGFPKKRVRSGDKFFFFFGLVQLSVKINDVWSFCVNSLKNTYLKFSSEIKSVVRAVHTKDHNYNNKDIQRII